MEVGCKADCRGSRNRSKELKYQNQNVLDCIRIANCKKVNQLSHQLCMLPLYVLYEVALRKEYSRLKNLS